MTPYGSGRSAALTIVGAISALAAIALAFPAESYAQGYPSKPIRIVVPFPPGGGTDLLGRLAAEQLAPRLGQPIVVENRPGATGTVGAVAVAQSPPDGYTLLVGTAAYAPNSLISPNPNFDVMNDLEFIGKLGRTDQILVVNAKSSIRTVQDLIALMRAVPNKVSYGTAGIGTGAHLGSELFKQLAKGEALHVPYKGESTAVADLLANITTFQMCTTNTCVSRIQDGSLRALAMASSQRSRLAPNVPTGAEVGVPGLESTIWFFLAAPKKTPAAIVVRLTSALNEFYGDEKFSARLIGLGVEADARTSPTEVREGLQAELEKWGPVIKAAGIKN